RRQGPNSAKSDRARFPNLADPPGVERRIGRPPRGVLIPAELGVPSTRTGGGGRRHEGRSYGLEWHGSYGELRQGPSDVRGAVRRGGTGDLLLAAQRGLTTGCPFVFSRGGRGAGARRV